MVPHRHHKAAKMKDTVSTVILIIQPMLCSNISSTKRVITHVTIKPLAGILTNNYAVMKSVKILTAEGGAYIRLLRPFSSAIVLQVRLSFLFKKCCEWRNHMRTFSWKERSDFPSEPWGDGAPQTHEVLFAIAVHSRMKSILSSGAQWEPCSWVELQTPLTMPMCVFQRNLIIQPHAIVGSRVSTVGAWLVLLSSESSDGDNQSER